MEMMLPNRVRMGPTEGNMPGACTLWLVPVDWIDTWPAEFNGVIADAIGLKTDRQWVEISAVKWTQEFAEEWRLDNGRQVAHASVSLEIPKDRPGVLHGLWLLKFGRYVVLHKDLNGQVKVMGTPSEPAMVRVEDVHHGRHPSNTTNGYLVTVQVARRSKCPFYEATPPQYQDPSWCPTLMDLIPQTTWEAIEPLLTAQQRIDAITSLTPSLCERMDIAFGNVPPPDNEDPLWVEYSMVADTIPYVEEVNGKGYWYSSAWGGPPDGINFGEAEVKWEDDRWVITIGGSIWISYEDVEHPSLVTEWSGIGDAPTVAAQVGEDPSAEAIVDCWNPSQLNRIRQLVCGNYAPVKVSVNEEEVASLLPGGEKNIPVKNSADEGVGTWDETGQKHVVGDVTVTRDGQPFAVVKAEGTVNVPSNLCMAIGLALGGGVSDLDAIKITISAAGVAHEVLLFRAADLNGRKQYRLNAVGCSLQWNTFYGRWDMSLFSGMIIFRGEEDVEDPLDVSEWTDGTPDRAVDFVSIEPVTSAGGDWGIIRCVTTTTAMSQIKEDAGLPITVNEDPTIHGFTDGEAPRIILQNEDEETVTPVGVEIDGGDYIVTLPKLTPPPELMFNFGPGDGFLLGNGPDGQGMVVLAGWASTYSAFEDDGSSGTIEYRINGGSWEEIDEETVIELEAGDVLDLRRNEADAYGWVMFRTT